MKIANNILELIDKTPLVRLNKIGVGNSEILLKLESFNPNDSVKDRIAISMIEDAEKRDILNQDTLIIEATSGNTGIGLAMVAAVKGYRLILAMSETMGIERRKYLTSFGVEIVLTEGSKGMKGALEKAKEIHAENVNSFMPLQFENLANPKYHEDTTAQEIWNDTDGTVDIIVTGVGTDGTISDVAKKFKSLKPSVKVYAVEPKELPVLSGGKADPHKIQGIGAGFIPKTYSPELVDEVLQVNINDTTTTARELAKKEGIHSRFSAGAALFAALEIAQKVENKKIAAIIPDSGSRYLSTFLYSPE